MVPRARDQGLRLMDDQPRGNRKRILIFLLVLVPALMFVAWSQASLNLSFLRRALHTAHDLIHMFLLHKCLH